MNQTVASGFIFYHSSCQTIKAINTEMFDNTTSKSLVHTDMHELCVQVSKYTRTVSKVCTFSYVKNTPAKLDSIFIGKTPAYLKHTDLCRLKN